MNWMRTSLLGASGGSMLALLASAPTSSVPELPALAARAAPATPSIAVPVLVETARLRARARASADGGRARRNPFAFAARPISATAPSEIAPPTLVPSTPPVRDPSPAYKFIGIANDVAGRGATAILSGPGGLQFLAAGDRSPDGLRVVTVGDDSVDLRADDERTVVLTLSK